MTIHKPGKDDFSLAKSYRVISPLNCLRKMAVKVAVMLISADCEATGSFHLASTDAECSARLLTRSDSPSLRPRRPGTKKDHQRPANGRGGSLPQCGERMPDSKDAKH